MQSRCVASPISFAVQSWWINPRHKNDELAVSSTLVNLKWEKLAICVDFGIDLANIDSNHLSYLLRNFKRLKRIAAKST